MTKILKCKLCGPAVCKNLKKIAVINEGEKSYSTVCTYFCSIADGNCIYSEEVILSYD